MISETNKDFKIPPLYGKKSLSELIINHLTVEWPLTAKSIHFRIARHKGVSFQAVHKNLQQLQEKRVITKANQEYSLNIAWLEELVRFGANTKKAYLGKMARQEKLTQLKKQWVE